MPPGGAVEVPWPFPASSPLARSSFQRFLGIRLREFPGRTRATRYLFTLTDGRETACFLEHLFFGQPGSLTGLAIDEIQVFHLLGVGILLSASLMAANRGVTVGP